MEFQVTQNLTVQAGMEWLHDRFVQFPDAQT